MIWTKLSYLQKIELLKNIITAATFFTLDRLVIDKDCRNHDKKEFESILAEINSISGKLKKKSESFYRITFLPCGLITVFDISGLVIYEQRIESKTNLKPADYYLFTDQNNESYLIDVDEHLG